MAPLLLARLPTSCDAPCFSPRLYKLHAIGGVLSLINIVPLRHEIYGDGDFGEATI